MYHKVTSLSIVTVLFALLGNTLDDPFIVEHPKNQSLYQGNTAMFQCISFRFDTILWIVNELPPELMNLSAPSVMIGDEKYTKVSILEVPAEIEYNNSRIVCIAFLYSNTIVMSETALLLVQGPPGKVEDFQGYNDTETSIVFEWEPPFHVEGTVCCLSYYVNVTHIISGDNIFNRNITTTNLNFTLEADRLCDLYVIQIIAYNEVGEGELFEQNWSLGGSFRTDAAEISVGYSGGDLILDVNITIVGRCLSQLNNATLYAKCPPEVPAVQKTNQISALPTDTITRTNFSVPIPCHDGVGTYDIALENSVDKGGIFYTFDVLRANYSVGPGTVCVTCYYIRSSPASGCRLVVSNTGVNKDREVAVNIPQERDEGCVEVASEGLYQVRIFDWNTDGSFSEEPAVDFEVISVPASEQLKLAGIVIASFSILVIDVVMVVILVVYILHKKNRNSKKNGIETDSGTNSFEMEERISGGNVRFTKPVQVAVNCLEGVLCVSSDSTIIKEGTELRGIRDPTLVVNNSRQETADMFDDNVTKIEAVPIAEENKSEGILVEVHVHVPPQIINEKTDLTTCENDLKVESEGVDDTYTHRDVRKTIDNGTDSSLVTIDYKLSVERNEPIGFVNGSDVISRKCTDLTNHPYNISKSTLTQQERALPSTVTTRTSSFNMDNYSGLFDETRKMALDENGLFHHCYKYGVTIIIPPGAVDQKCTLQFGACLTFPHFRSKDSFIPVSPIVWIHIDRELLKPAVLYISHYVDISCDEDKKKLCLLISKDNPSEGDEAFVFTESDIAVTCFETSARIDTIHFCSVYIAFKGKIPPKKRYHLLFAENVLEDGKIHLDSSISLCTIQNVEEQYEKYKGTQDEVTLQKHGPVFVKDGSMVTVKFDHTDIPGWVILFRDDYYITEDMIDFYKVLACTPDTLSDDDIETLKMYEEQMSYPPRFKLKFSPTGPKIIYTQVKLILHELYEGSQDGPPVSHIVRLGSEETGSSPTNLISSTYPDISSCNSVITPDPVSIPTFSDDDDDHDHASSSGSDSFIFDLMKFLELKLQRDWIQFGYRLNIPVEELHKIEVNAGQDSKRCIKQVLLMWRKFYPAASWEPIAEALKQCGLSLLSAIVTKQYTSHQCTDSLDYPYYDVLASISSCPLLHTEPEIAMLTDLVGAVIPAKWEFFGQQVGLDEGCLDCLRADYEHDCVQRFYHVFIEWKKQKSSDFTWATVIKVLYSRTIDFCDERYSKFKET